MTNTLNSIAQEIYEELTEPSDISIGSITFWLRHNIGLLNNILFVSFAIGDDGQTGSEINDDQKSIFKKLFYIYYYSKLINSNLGASGFSSVQEIDSDGGKVKLVNKTELAKVYKDLKKQENEELNKLINDYRLKNSSPQAVYGDDTGTEEYSS